MTTKMIDKSIIAAENALRLLKEALGLLKMDAPEQERMAFYIDAIIKRYEILFEYTWKMLKVAADFQGVEAPGPRPAILEAQRFGWIDDPDFWAFALDARNGSVHDYFGITREEYLDIIKRFVTEVEKAIEKLRAIERKPACAKSGRRRRT